jgi:methylenetetrahydrofolate reductase (NADPH)
MKSHISNRSYHIELIPPKQDSEKLPADLDAFAAKFRTVMEGGYCACITDNAMGLLAFQGAETIEELRLDMHPEQVMIHLNTFHSRRDLGNILDSCAGLGIKYLLVVSGDGSDRLPKLRPQDIGAEGETASVTSVELIRFILKEYPGAFEIGAAFNPYEPEDHEFAKLDHKLEAGAAFIITQPVIERNAVVDKLLRNYPDLPVFVEAWMTKKLHLLSDVVGYTIPENAAYDPIATLGSLQSLYPKSGYYLSLLGFKTQYPVIRGMWK